MPPGRPQMAPRRESASGSGVQPRPRWRLTVGGLDP